MKEITILLLVFVITISFNARAQIRVNKNQHSLETTNGKPFFWLGDTDWELFHRLTREEAEELINVRSEQGFNVLQIVALAEFNGIRQPNRYGNYPLKNEDPTQLLLTPGSNSANVGEYDYWDHVEFIISKAEEKGIYIGLLPAWGDKVTPNWGEGPAIFNVQNAEAYGQAIAQRLVKNRNIIWILGGDRPAIYKSKKNDVEYERNDVAIWAAMAKGIESVVGNEAFITYHPSGGEYRTTNYLRDQSWCDMNAFQSGHGSRDADPWRWVKEDLAFKPQKPTLDMEPCYEDHPVNPWDGKWTRARGYFSAYDVRARIYRGIFAGACGVTYGHHQVWQFLNSDLYQPINTGDTIIGWRKALYAEAATEMKHLKNLLLSRPYFSRINDQSLVKSAIGSTYIDLVYATRDENRSYAFIYLPQNKAIKIDLGKISGNTKNIWWYDVRSGKALASYPVKGKKLQTFTPPDGGKDWVLVIDDASHHFKAPGLVTQ
jgi:hypothetical protein